MGKAKGKLYGVADKAWQPVVGCDPAMPCAKRCWARRTVARIVKCQEPTSPDRAKFFQIALTPNGREWSGKTVLDEAHLLDPMKWRKPAVIATGFHGDWGRLADFEKDRMAAVMILCPQHEFMPLTKQPVDIVFWCNRLEAVAADWRPQTKTGEFSPSDVLNLRWMHATFGGGPAFPYHEWPPKNVSIGCSVMYQSGQYGADQMRDPMAKLAALGWRTHVWYEPAIGPVDWNGWEFLELLIIGGESNSGGVKARPFDIQWARDSRDWCRDSNTRLFMKQAGSHVIQEGEHRRKKDRKGADMSEWPHDIRIREGVSAMVAG